MPHFHRNPASFLTGELAKSFLIIILTTTALMAKCCRLSITASAAADQLFAKWLFLSCWNSDFLNLSLGSEGKSEARSAFYDDLRRLFSITAAGFFKSFHSKFPQISQIFHQPLKSLSLRRGRADRHQLPVGPASRSAHLLLSETIETLESFIIK